MHQSADTQVICSGIASLSKNHSASTFCVAVPASIPTASIPYRYPEKVTLAVSN
jgi:hypothetical protein